MKSNSSRTGTTKRQRRRIVVKFGTSLLTGGSERLNQEMMTNLVSQVAEMHGLGMEPIVVSSGAMAAGRYKLV